MKSEYLKRVYRVMDYIDENISQPLELEELASVANFSPYHFHRIFSALIGEPIYQYVLRLKVEKAAIQLLQDPRTSVTDVAFNCGFSSSSTFARSFKEKFGMSASQWRKNKQINCKHIDDSKNCKEPRKMSEVLAETSLYVDPVNGQQTWRLKMKDSSLKDVKVEVKNIEEMDVAYVRYIGPYKGDSSLFEKLFNKLFQWAGPRELFNPSKTKIMTVYHDDPELTEEDKLRMSTCITVPEDTEVEGEIGKMKVAGGKYAVGTFEIDADEYPQAWSAMFGGWLPESGYQPDDRPCFEHYINDPKQHPENKHQVAIYIPIKPI